jgi:hypothetical protein
MRETALSRAFAACAFEAAELFFVAADAGGNGFEAMPELVDLNGQAGQGAGVASAGAVFVDDRAQVGAPVESGAADAGERSDLGKGDGLAVAGQGGAGGLDFGKFLVLSWHRPG